MYVLRIINSLTTVGVNLVCRKKCSIILYFGAWGWGARVLDAGFGKIPGETRMVQGALPIDGVFSLRQGFFSSPILNYIHIYNCFFFSQGRKGNAKEKINK